MTKYLTAFLSVVAIGIAAGLMGQEKGQPSTAPQKAIAVLHPTEGNKATGIVFLAQKNGYVEITGEISDLSPGPHGFHVHEFGDFSAKDGKSAGDHFNPTNMPHGRPSDAMRHVGDLGNLQADRSGKATVKIHDKLIKLNGPHSIIGRGLVVHAKADDFKTQPTGDAGDRVAVGVIGLANPSPKK